MAPSKEVTAVFKKIFNNNKCVRVCLPLRSKIRLLHSLQATSCTHRGNQWLQLVDISVKWLMSAISRSWRTKSWWGTSRCVYSTRCPALTAAVSCLGSYFQLMSWLCASLSSSASTAIRWREIRAVDTRGSMIVCRHSTPPSRCLVGTKTSSWALATIRSRIEINLLSSKFRGMIFFRKSCKMCCTTWTVVKRVPPEPPNNKIDSQFTWPPQIIPSEQTLPQVAQTT